MLPIIIFFNFEINLFGELPPKKYGIDFVYNYTLWKYNGLLVKRSDSSRLGDVWRYPGFHNMFHFHPTESYWVKKVCTICHTSKCVRLTHIDYLAVNYRKVNHMDNIGDKS